MIGLQYNDSVDIKRLAVVSGAKKTYGAHLSSVACHIQPLNDSIDQDISVGFGKNFVLFCAVLDIVEGDRVIWGSKEYRIVGMESFTMGTNPHMELTIRIFQS